LAIQPEPLVNAGRASELRGKNHSSHSGRKAYRNFELKDAPKARGLRPSQILDFNVQIRSGRLCDEWSGAAGAALYLKWRYWRGRKSDIPES
jgi:hypothetical protein